MKHTPGPWKVSQTGFGVMNDVSRIASCRYKRDANLIAAAPELLEAVKALEHAIGMGIDTDPELYRKAHQLAALAIAKAEGRSE